MPVVIYDRDGNGQEVPDETAARLVSSGDYTLQPGSRITVRNQLGGITSVDDAGFRRDDRYTPYAGADEAQDIRKERLKDKTSIAGSLVRGIGSGLSFGGTDYLADEETIEADKLHHGVARGVGEFGGVAATLLIPGGGEANAARIGAEGALELGSVARAARIGEEVVGAERAAAGLGRVSRAVGRAAEYTPLGQVTKLARSAGGIVKGEGVAARIARAGVSGATFGGVEAAGRELVHQVTDDVPGLDAESIISHGFTGAAVGGGLGLGGAALSEGIGAAGSAVSGVGASRSVAKGLDPNFGLGLDVGVAQSPGVVAKAKDAIGSLGGMLPGPIGRLAKQGISTAAVLEFIQEGGIHKLASVLGSVAPIAAGAALGAKAITAGFANPVVGGILAAHGSQVLDGFSLTGDDRRPPSPPRDVRHAAVDFAKRVRSVTPDMAAIAAGRAMPPHADPNVLVRAQESARNRQNMLIAAVDREVPAPRSVAGGLMGTRLPSGESARRVVEIARVASSPLSFLEMAAKGRLSQQSLALAQGLWPAHLAATRQRLLDWLSSGPKMDPAERRTTERLLGEGLLDPRDSRRVAYDSAMSASHMRAKMAAQQQAQQQGPAPSKSAAPMPQDPATQAANPGH